MGYLLSHLLTDSARNYPGRPAVSFKGQALTYAELEAQTNRLAGLLRSAGIGRGDRVGIYLNKSIESVVSIFGILKAGGVYVPLDPNSPARRVAYIIENCAMRFLVTSLKKLDALKESIRGEGAPGTVLLVDSQHSGNAPWTGTQLIPWMASRSVEEPNLGFVDMIDTDLAYVLYTSGSTGDPKGVMLTHRHALTFINWASDTFQITSEDRLSNHAPLHFDLSILDIFCAIKAGATVVLVPEGLSTFPIRLAEFIHEQRITIWYSVPSALTLMLIHGQLQRFSFERLRAVLFAGEVFPVKYLRALMDSIPNATYYNLYGPTETNVCTFYQVPRLTQDRTKPIPIGKPCANADVFALNEQGRRIVCGEEGELYVCGSLVTKGYWKDPERTQRAIAQNPLQPNFHELVYRTGDIVTLDDDGNYLLIGRRDHMVKCRGYRIELGEIETALYSHPLIREAAIVTVPDETVGNRLKAFIVLDDAHTLDENEIKRYCSERIPHYMIPETVEFRPALPKTSTGKIDRRLLGTAL